MPGRKAAAKPATKSARPPPAPVKRKRPTEGLREAAGASNTSASPKQKRLKVAFDLPVAVSTRPQPPPTDPAQPADDVPEVAAAADEFVAGDNAAMAAMLRQMDDAVAVDEEAVDARGPLGVAMRLRGEASAAGSAATAKLELDGRIVMTPQRGDALREKLRNQAVRQSPVESSLLRRSPNRYQTLLAGGGGRGSETPPSRRSTPPVRAGDTQHRLVALFLQLVSLFQKVGKTRRRLSLADVRRFLDRPEGDEVTEADLSTIAAACSHLLSCAWTPLSDEDQFRRDCGASNRLEGRTHGHVRSGHVLTTAFRKDPTAVTLDDVARAKEKLARAPANPCASTVPPPPVPQRGMNPANLNAPISADIAALRKKKDHHKHLLEAMRLKHEIETLEAGMGTLQERYENTRRDVAAREGMVAGAPALAQQRQLLDRAAERDRLLQEITESRAAVEEKREQLAEIVAAAAASDATTGAGGPSREGAPHTDSPTRAGSSGGSSESSSRPTPAAANAPAVASAVHALDNFKGNEAARVAALFADKDTIDRKEKLKHLYALMVEWRSKKVKHSEKKVVFNIRTGAKAVKEWSLAGLRDLLVGDGAALPPHVELGVRHCTGTTACVAVRCTKTHAELLGEAWKRVTDSEGLKMLLQKLELQIGFNVSSKHASRMMYSTSGGRAIPTKSAAIVGQAIQTLLSRAKVRAQLTMEPHGDPAAPTGVFVRIAVPSDEQALTLAVKAAKARIASEPLRKTYDARVVDMHVQQTSGSTLPTLASSFRVPVATFVAELSELHVSSSATGLSTGELREFIRRQLDEMAKIAPSTVQFQSYEDSSRACVRLLLDKSVKDFGAAIDAARNAAAA